MLIGHRMKGLAGAVDRKSPEVEPPVDEFSNMIIDIGILHNDRPLSNTGLTPEWKCQD